MTRAWFCIEYLWENTPEMGVLVGGELGYSGWVVGGDLLSGCHLNVVSRAHSAHSKINKKPFSGCLLKRLQ